MISEKEILEKTFELFSRYGIKSQTMSDIATALGISKKTLYKFVTDKHDLVRKVFLNPKPFHNIDDQTGEKNAIEEFYSVYLMVMDIIKNTHPHMIYDLRKYYPDVYSELRQRRKRIMIGNVIENIKKGQKEGLFRNDINVTLIAELYYLKTEALIETDFINTGGYSVNEILKELFKYHILGISTDKGREFLAKFKIFENDEEN